MKFGGIRDIFEVDSGCGGCCVHAYDRLMIFVRGQRGAMASATALIARQKAPATVPSSVLICSSSGRAQVLSPSFAEICGRRSRLSAGGQRQQLRECSSVAGCCLACKNFVSGFAVSIFLALPIAHWTSERFDQQRPQYCLLGVGPVGGGQNHSGSDWL
jgi:hypothetical protein